MDFIFGDATNTTNTTKPKIDDPQLTVDNSIKAFTSALLFNAALGAGLFTVFCIVRHWSKKIYQPRTYLVNKEYVQLVHILSEDLAAVGSSQP